jgi:AbiV family abortive infection protein
MISFSLTDSQLKDTFLKCIENVNGLLESAGILLLNGSTQQYALGMYMYAIEEYGKALLLKHCFTGGDQYPVPRWIFGRGRPPSGKNAHEEKLAAGLENMPLICTKLSRAL